MLLTVVVAYIVKSSVKVFTGRGAGDIEQSVYIYYCDKMFLKIPYTTKAILGDRMWPGRRSWSEYGWL